jgi:hypothetical protein
MTSTITFFDVGPDLETYQYLLVEGDQPEVNFDGSPARDQWWSPDVISFQPRLREGDFWGVLGLGGASFAVRPETLESTQVELFLRPAGELLPLMYEGREFRVMNITECIDALDREATVWDYYEDVDSEADDVEPLERELIKKLHETGEVDRPVFRLDRLGWQLFKVPETAWTNIYYWERSEDDPRDQFRGFCELHGLTGLQFTPIYTTESPW